MAADDESLMDVFVNVKPDDAILAATEGLIDDAVTRIRQKFLGLQNTTVSQARAAAAQISQIQVNVGGGFRGGSGGGTRRRDDSDELDDSLRRFREASRAAEDLVEQSRQLNVVLKEVGSTGIQQQFETAANELKRVQNEIRRNSQDNDLLGLEGTVRDLDLVTARFRELQVLASQQRNVREQFNQVISEERDSRSRENVRDRLQTSVTRGLPSGETREQIARARAEVKLFENEFDRLVRDFDGSAEHLERLVQVSQRLNGSLDAAGARSGLARLQNDAQSSSRSMNNLQNNAYQLGQAFEDAAVGFSLNGIAGAIRGSANNVAFLINDLSRIPAVQNRIGAGFASWLPLIAGIGGALAITVLPKMIEWLESLNDIDTKTKDITAELKRGFQDVDFRIGLGIEESDLQRTLLEARGLDEIISALKRLNAEAENGKTKVREMLAGFEEAGGLQKIRDSLRETSGIVTDELDLIVQARERLARAAGIDVKDLPSSSTDPGALNLFQDISNARLKTVKDFSDAIGSVVQQIETARLNSRSGIIDEKQLQQTERQIFSLSQKIEEFTKTADLADEKFGETLKGNLEAANAEFEKMRDISRQVASQIQVQFDDALEVGAKKTEELRDRLDIIRSTIAGIGRETSLFLDELSNVSEEYARQINSSTLLTDQQKQSAIALERQNSLLQLQIREVEIREQLRETEEKIEAVREKSRKASFINLESYLQKLQVNVLSDDPQKQQLDALMKQREQELAALAQQEVAQNRIRGGREFGDIGVPFRNGFLAVPDPMDKRNDPLNQMIEKELIRGFFEMTKEQKNTTEAVKKLELGARAG